MKTFNLFAVGAMLFLAPGLVHAQTARTPLVRADVTGLVGLIGVEAESGGGYSGDDWHSSFFGGIGVGWHWTDHLKTELDFGAGTESTFYRARPIVFQGHSGFVPSQSTVSQRTLGISQQYQFFRNAWFHPHVAVGADVTWETTADRFEPFVIYGPHGPSPIVAPPRDQGPSTDVIVRPFVASGFKAYFTQRGFFRTDLRFAFRDGLEEVMLRAGFGVDF